MVNGVKKGPFGSISPIFDLLFAICFALEGQSYFISSS